MTPQKLTEKLIYNAETTRDAVNYIFIPGDMDILLNTPEEFKENMETFIHDCDIQIMFLERLRNYLKEIKTYEQLVEEVTK